MVHDINVTTMSDEDKLVSHLFERLNCTQGQTRAFIKEVLDDISLFDQKQRDYGPQNIATFGETGVLIRANDKMARLVNLLWNRRDDRVSTDIFKDPANESIEDSWRDLSVYGVIVRLCRQGLWNS